MPLLFFFNLCNFYFLYTSLIGIRLVGGVGGLNQHSVRSIAVYSSFVHTRWIISAIFISLFVFFFYFFWYCICVGFLFLYCKEIGKRSLKIKSNSLIGFFCLIIVRGLPPFLGFLGKVIVIILRDFYMVFFCIIGSLIRIKYYLSFMYGIVILRRQSKDTIINRKKFISKLIVFVNFLGIIFILFLFI